MYVYVRTCIIIYLLVNKHKAAGIKFSVSKYVVFLVSTGELEINALNDNKDKPKSG